MIKKIIFTILIIAIFMFIILALINNKNSKILESNIKQENVANVLTPLVNNQSEVKEFSMASYTEMVDGSPKPRFSLQDITVNKGDTVRIKITVTSGMHDFKIDEYDIYEDTQLNKESIIEFTADKAGEFVYYCTKPGHKQNGQWGTFRVL